MNEELKQNLIKISVLALVFFLVSYLAFCLTLKHHIKKLNSPFYQMQRMEKMLEKQNKDFDKFVKMDNPFEPKMRPMFINLVKEANEYKVIIDLKELDGNEDAINVTIQNNELTIKGELDKKSRNNERIINFAQTYYLDEKIQKDEITKERIENKYIITIPFED